MNDKTKQYLELAICEYLKDNCCKSGKVETAISEYSIKESCYLGEPLVYSTIIEFYRKDADNLEYVIGALLSCLPIKDKEVPRLGDIKENAKLLKIAIDDYIEKYSDYD